MVVLLGVNYKEKASKDCLNLETILDLDPQSVAYYMGCIDLSCQVGLQNYPKLKVAWNLDCPVEVQIRFKEE